MKDLTIGVQASFKSIVRELLLYALPIFLTLLAIYGVGFFERICLARYSLESLKGAMQALYALQLFQGPLNNFATMVQIFLGKHMGAEEFHEVGPTVWQMCWIAMFSMLLIIPLSLITGPILFKGIEGEVSAYAYFNTLSRTIFLFPISIALSSFFYVQGLGAFVARASLFVTALNLILDLPFIFGLPYLFPPLGALGASIGVVANRLVFCGILFYFFLKSSHRTKYQTHQWSINFYKIRTYVKASMPRALGRMVGLLNWAMVSHFIALKGGDYLSVLSIGGTLTLFYYLFTESVVQGLMMIFARQIGAQQYQDVSKSWQTGLLLFVILTGCFAIPCVIFPDALLSLFFPHAIPESLRTSLHLTLMWAWGWIVFNSLASLFLAFLLAMKDTLFIMAVTMSVFITSGFPIYLFIHRLNGPPETVWLILALEHLIIALVYLYRSRYVYRTLRLSVGLPST